MLDENKLVLAWPNFTDRASVSGGSYLNSLPLVNIKNRVFTKKARSTNLDYSSTQFELEFDGSKQTDVISIAAHNFSNSAKIRVRFYADIQKTELLYDTGETNVWPSVYSQDELEWETFNYWEGTVLQEDIENFTPLFYHIAKSDALIYPRKILVEIFDSSNPIGYIEFGRVFVGTAFQPKLNMQFGASIGYSINTEVETSQNNTEYFDRKRPRRTASFNLDGLSMQEGHSTILSLIRTQGIDQEVFFTYQNTEDTLQYNRTFVARLQQVDPIRQPYFDRVETSINLLEII
jgi:hypothetical protein